MSLYNHQLTFRPLLGGVEIYVPRVDEVGTLGLIAQDIAGGDEWWLISCYHVLVGGPQVVPVAGEGVLQSASTDWPVAFVDELRADAVLDCATAKIDPGIKVTSGILAIGGVGFPTEPEIGMRVLKSGAASGVTEGIIENIVGDDVTIGIPPDFDPDYDLSLPGDSGSVWLSREEHLPVALHIQSIPNTRKTVKAMRMLSILRALRLKFTG